MCTQQSCWRAGAYFHPLGKDELLSTSYDDTLRTWAGTGAAWEQQTSARHNHQTGRWISPFKAIWAPDGNTVLCGDMKRGVFCLDPAAGKSQLLTSELMTAISPRLACHPTMNVVAVGSGSGRLHLWTHA